MNPQEHDAHMQAMQEGLKQILASEDINEIKAIAQSLLGQEEAEAGTEGNEEGLREKLMNMGGEGE